MESGKFSALDPTVNEEVPVLQEPLLLTGTSGFTLCSMPMVKPLTPYQLLAFLARDRCDAAYYQRLSALAEGFTEWEKVPALAAQHGLGPLAYKHLRAANISVPQPVPRELQGMLLQARHASRVRVGVLADLLTEFERRGVMVLVLKGAVVAHLVYSEPAVRPMSDIDLLIRPSEMEEAKNVLRHTGFSVHPNGMPVLYRDGLYIGVELHDNLSNEPSRHSKTLDDLNSPFLTVPLGEEGATALTLGFDEMLWHLHSHMLFHTTVFTAHRLLWSADLITFAECFVEEMDWETIRNEHPAVQNTLSVLQWMTPLSERLLDRAMLRGTHAPQGIGEEFQGWPRTSLQAQHPKGWLRILQDTFFPSEWWLRLHYNLASSEPLFRHRWFNHPLHILGWSRHLLKERAEQRRTRSPKRRTKQSD